MTKEKLLNVRKQIKSRKPTYKRVQAHQFAKLRNDEKWRFPKGMGNKVRRNRRGKPSIPTVGFGSPKVVRGLNRAGFAEVVVFNVADVAKVNPKEDAIVIAKSVGGKKTIAILEEAKKLKLNVSNVKDLDVKIKALTKEKKEKVIKKVSKADKKKVVEKKTETKTEEASKE